MKPAQQRHGYPFYPKGSILSMKDEKKNMRLNTILPVLFQVEGLPRDGCTPT
jgi:hypothetical protein